MRRGGMIASEEYWRGILENQHITLQWATQFSFSSKLSRDPSYLEPLPRHMKTHPSSPCFVK